MTDAYDVIIIGTGAGGGTLALSLAPSGKRILLLERGGWLPREKQNWNDEEVFVDNRYVSKETWFDRSGAPFQPGLHYFVGGATKMYGAALYRLRERDFGELRHHDGISPAWPISYAEMDPYYTRAENLYQVHGARGEDPTEPPASAPYPRPAVSHEPRIQLSTVSLALRILLDEGNMPMSACVRCADCDGFPCLVQAKADAEVIAVRPALQFPNVTLMTNARATQLRTNAAGTAVTEVVVDHDGAVESYRAGILVVSCGAANSARLLLASANDKHPRGLANGSDQVGRNYMFHNSAAVLAVSKEPNPTRYQKTLGLNDFYFGTAEFAFPLGSVQMMGKSQAPMFRGEVELAKLAHLWSLEILAGHAVDFWLTTEDLPLPDNRVTLQSDGSIRLVYEKTNQLATKKLYQQLKSMLSHLGMHPDHLHPHNLYMKNDMNLAAVGHQAGTCRFGTDRATSVLDVHCKTHEIDNLYVVDTSFFPSIGAVNPGLTTMANALRVGDHLRPRL
jgi:choline dehydrogenase-like flavoprotein